MYVLLLHNIMTFYLGKCGYVELKLNLVWPKSHEKRESVGKILYKINKSNSNLQLFILLSSTKYF